MPYIVIEIPDNFNLENEINTVSNSVIRKALKNGTPLPEHHGRLIDADALLRNTILNPCHAPYIVKLDVDGAETIIPATKEGDGE